MEWITRSRARVDRIACPWLISRFIDPTPEFMYGPVDAILAEAEKHGAIPYDIQGVELGLVFFASHVLTAISLWVAGQACQPDRPGEHHGLYAHSLQPPPDRHPVPA